MEFTLYRIKVIRPAQPDLFVQQIPSSLLLRGAILSRPTVDSGHAAGWHIGNTEEISDSAVYFKLGRTARARTSTLDPESQDFVEREFESAPYTHVLVDLALEVCAIAQKANLSPTTDAIARQLQRLLSVSGTAEESKIEFSVSSMSQPDEFLHELRVAYAVTSFTVTFTRPNPVDVEGDFLRPMERLTQETNGSSGSTTIKGQALDPEPLTKLARSAAATGDDAKARLRPHRDTRLVTRSLRGARARMNQDRIETGDEKVRFVERLREKYRQIRGHLDEEVG